MKAQWVGENQTRGAQGWQKKTQPKGIDTKKAEMGWERGKYEPLLCDCLSLAIPAASGRCGHLPRRLLQVRHFTVIHRHCHGSGHHGGVLRCL